MTFFHLANVYICEKCFSDEIESEEHLLKCSFYYTSRRKLLETIKNNINHSNFEKFSFGDKFIWLLNSESRYFNMHVWFPVKKSLIAGISYFNTTVTSLILVYYNLFDILCNHLMFYYVYMPLRGPFNLDQ